MNNLPSHDITASLVQAAPQLLAAARAIVAFWDLGIPCHPRSEWADDLREAIAAATGTEAPR